MLQRVVTVQHAAPRQDLLMICKVGDMFMPAAKQQEPCAYVSCCCAPRHLDAAADAWAIGGG